jgi:hypothetical protein
LDLASPFYSEAEAASSSEMAGGRSVVSRLADLRVAGMRPKEALMLEANKVRECHHHDEVI